MARLTQISLRPSKIMMNQGVPGKKCFIYIDRRLDGLKKNKFISGGQHA